MLENQSFDRLVGLTPGVDGVDPHNLRSNFDSLHSVSVQQNPAAQATTYNPARMDFDPKHDLDDVLSQSKGNCAGFVDNFVHNYGKGNPPEIMAYYGADYLPVLNTLASKFVTCDRWFFSVPGPTWPNRFFVNTGTSLGHVDMPDLAHFDPAWHNYDQPTVFERLSDAAPKM
jgi:phospholipase C